MHNLYKIIKIKYASKAVCVVLCVCLVMFITNSQAQQCGKWVFGYLPTYQQATNGSISFLTSSDYSKLNFIGHHGPTVNTDGTLNMSSNGATAIRLLTAVNSAHTEGVPILLSVVSWVDYIIAIQNATTRTVLINNILTLFDTYSYDGIDLDMEPIMSPYVAGIQTGNPNYILFVNQLFDSLQTRTSTFLGTKPLLSVAANGYAAPVLNQLQSKFDMINIMTYDLAGPYPGWVVWHDSPIYSGGNIMPSTGQPMPCVDKEIQLCLSNNVNHSKLGIGISFDAFRWKGGNGTTTGGTTLPMQSYSSDPTWTRFSYADFMHNNYNSVNYHYDYNAKMSYQSNDVSGNSNDEFWSFNDKKSCEDKVNYIWDNWLGGLIIWELKSGFIPTNTVGNRIPQLNYITNENCRLFYNQCKCN